MCGVAALYAYHPAASPVDVAELARMSARLAARGPDGDGRWIAADGRVALAHRRLAIIDLDPRAAQPMHAADGRAVLSFNGEIYNYRALREQLQREGATFRTGSDTEVLLALYSRDGERALDAVRGMYAFALWDARRGALLLARDPYGIKPLYYADDGWTLRVASQVKALQAGGAVSSTLEPAGQVGFALFGSVPEPFTTLQAVRCVPAGHWLWVDECGPRTAHRHFSIAACYADAPPPDQPAELARAAARESIRAHAVADVPVGVFLSGGVDSSAVLGMLAEDVGPGITAVSVGFAGFEGTPNDELELAAATARYYGARHVTRRVDEAEFQADLPRILDAMDQPSIDGFNTWFAAKAAREAGLKVVLSGVGGDELCGGYRSFSEIPRRVARLRWPARIPFAGFALRRLLSPLLSRQTRISPKAAGLLEYAGDWAGAWMLQRAVLPPWMLGEVLGVDTAAEGLRRLRWPELLQASLQPDPGDDFARVATLEANHYLRKQLLRDADWASMAHGVEVRTPLVDAWLLRGAARAFEALGATGGKALLAGVPRRAIPDAVLARPKTGFVTPAAAWISRATGAASAARDGGAGSRMLVHELLGRVPGWAR